MKYIVTLEVKVSDQDAKEIRETIDVYLPDSSFFEVKVLDVKESK